MTKIIAANALSSNGQLQAGGRKMRKLSFAVMRRNRWKQDAELGPLHANALSALLTYGIHLLLFVLNAHAQAADGGLIGFQSQAVCILTLIHCALIGGFIGPPHMAGVTVCGVRLGWWRPKLATNVESGVQALLMCLQFFGSGVFLFYNKTDVRVGCPDECDDGITCPLTIIETIGGNLTAGAVATASRLGAAVLAPTEKEILVRPLVGPDTWYTCRYDGGEWTRMYSVTDALYYVVVLTSSVGCALSTRSTLRRLRVLLACARAARSCRCSVPCGHG